MTIVKSITLPKDDRGNDPNDFRGDAEFVAKINDKPQANLGWIQSFMLTKKEVDELSDPQWIYENLIIKGHLIVIPAEPNAGKTTILMQIAGDIAADYKVCYVNSDVGSGDVKVMQAQADKMGFSLLLPDMKVGLSMDDVVNRLVAMNAEDADYSDVVFMFDTLKKMVDVISKSRAKELYKTLRGLTARGMTIILLAHTNKYVDSDGKPIYEGTGDLRSDVDDMIYLVPKKNADGSMVVSTKPDKIRGKFQPITFHIDPDRNVTKADEYIDTAATKMVEKQREKDETIIEAITEAIEAGNIRQTEIISYCGQRKIAGRRVVENALRRYQKSPIKLWNCQKGFEKNAKIYKLVK